MILEAMFKRKPQLTPLQALFTDNFRCVTSTFVIAGRLQMSKVDGKNADGKYSEFYSYGGRSFSIWEINSGSMTQVFDRYA